MKLIELQGSVDQNGELAIPRTLLVDMGLRPGDSVRLTYASGSGAMDNTHRQFVVTPDGIAAAMLKPREDSCGCGLTLPHELLEASDFPRDCDLEVVCAPGAIVILSADISTGCRTICARCLRISASTRHGSGGNEGRRFPV